MNRKRTIISPLLVLLLYLLLLTAPGCAIRSVYIPLSQNVPLFDTSKQVKASGYLGANHAELQLAHNPMEHFAIAANVYFGAGIASYDAAVGTHGRAGDNKWHYELFAGYGYNSNIDYHGGNLLSVAQKVSYDVASLYHRMYVQPAIGFFNKIKIYGINYSFSFSLKTSYLYFKDYIFREMDEARSTSTNPVYLTNKEYHDKPLITFEPCITNKVGIKHLYAILQVQAITPYSKQIDVGNTVFSPGLTYSVGLQYDLTFKAKKP